MYKEKSTGFIFVILFHTTKNYTGFQNVSNKLKNCNKSAKNSSKFLKFEFVAKKSKLHQVALCKIVALPSLYVNTIQLKNSCWGGNHYSMDDGTVKTFEIVKV